MKHFLKRWVARILTAEARILLRRHNPTVIAVTGSVGKTATKDALYTVLRKHYRVRKSEQSFNSEIGVPLTVLGLRNAWSNPVHWMRNLIAGLFVALFSRSYPELLVIEAGVDAPGDMRKLTSWLRPHYVVLTRLPDIPVHVEKFASPEAVVAEKMELVHALLPEGVLVYNQDDVTIQEQVATVRQRSVGYGRYSDAPYRISQDRTTYRDDVPTGIEYTLTTPTDSGVVAITGTLGMQTAYVYTAAAAVAGEFGIPVSDVVADLAQHELPAGRMRILPGIKGTVLIDDSYNSSPVAVESALQTLGELKYATRKIAVLGDMLELGQYSVAQHERIGALVPRVADVLCTVGVRARGIAQGALAHGLSDPVVFQYDDAARAGQELQTMLRPGDVVLIKGSQGIRTERIVEEVMREPLRAPELLVRQSAEWKRKN